MNTKEAIMSQLLENTGIHMCDSGGVNGRAWQRNQGKKWDELAFGCEVEAYIYTHSEPHKLELILTVSLASYMENNLEYDAELQEAYEEFTKDRDDYHMAMMQDFAELYEEAGKVCYTYNWDNCLSQDIQFITFEHDGDRCALIQVHGGADARGGLTSPKAYRIKGDHYLGDCTVNNYWCNHKSWDEGGESEDGEDLFKLPVFAYEHQGNLLKQLVDLAQTTHNVEEAVALMRTTNEQLKQKGFEEFCDSLDEVSVVVFEHKAYYVGLEGPEEIFAESYSLMG